MADKTRNISFRKLIFNDKYLIIIALLLAVVVWVITSLNIGTDETRTVHLDVPIKISDDLSKQLGMQYYTLKETVEIDVTLSGAKYVVGQISEKDLNIKFDTSNVNRAGEQSIPILVTNKSNSKDFTVTSVYPSTLEAYFDVKETETFDISLVYNQDNVADGYVFGTPVISEDKVVVSGPKTYVDNIERIEAEADFGKEKNLKESFSQECTLKVKGQGVEANYLTLMSKTNVGEALNKVDVTLPVLKQSYIPVSVNFEDVPAGLNKEAIDVSYSIDRINVGILESTDINKAILGSISYSQLGVGKNEFDFNVNDIQGVFVLDDQDTDITVTVTVSDSFYREITLPIKASDVTISGNKKNSKAVVSGLDSSYVTVVVPSTTELKSTDIKLTADVSEKNDDGIYPVKITVSDKNCWAYGNYNATVELN